MCQHRMNSVTIIIGWRAFLKESAILRKLKNKVASQAKHILLSRRKAVEFKGLHYFPLQFNLSLLNWVFSSVKWSLPYPTRPKTRL